MSIAFLIFFQLCETTCVRLPDELSPAPDETWPMDDSSRSCMEENANLLDFGEEVADDCGEPLSPD